MSRLIGLLSKTNGNVAPLMALMIVPIVGALAIGGETSSWFTMGRSQQNAADSAVITAALNGGGTYVAESRGVAASYGYANGGNITVTPATVACPAGAAIIAGTLCYKVSINRTVPVYLTRVVGYAGDGTLVGGATGKLIKASAIAGTISGTKNFCFWALNRLKFGGGNGTNLTGCDLMSGGSMQCSGTNSDFGVAHAYAVGTNQNCGDPVSVGGYSGYTGDPEATAFAANLAATSLSSCPAGGTITSLSSGVNCFTGSVTLGANVSVTNPNTVLVIKADPSGNGTLDIKNFKLSTASGASLTIVYTGSNRFNTPVIVSNGGTIDIADPSTGNWKGMAIVEDPNATGKNLPGNKNALDINFSGAANQITLDITGLIYLPHAEFNINGGIDHASFSDHGTGAYDSCIGLVAYSINLTGTNDILPNPTQDCYKAGLNLPTVPMVALLH